MQLVASYNYTVRIVAATKPGIDSFSDLITVIILEDGGHAACIIVTCY